MKPLDAINKKSTIIAATLTGLGTIVLFPQVQQTLVAVVSNPNPQNIGATFGALLTAALLYFAHPVGTSSSSDPTPPKG